MTLHLIKLAVGVEDVAHLRRIQTRRRQEHGEVFHLTRMVPARAAALLDGGSIYWVLRGLVSARQRLLDIRAELDAEGRRRCRLLLDADLVEVERRPQRAFQGWRYLAAADAPPDRREWAGADDEPPPEMAAELRRLGLI